MPRATPCTTTCPALLHAIALLLLGSSALTGCHSAPDAPVHQLSLPRASEEDDIIPSPETPLIEPTVLRVQSYDGSGQLVHPDAVVVARGWNGHRYWFAATPYPMGNSAFENPSLFHGAAPTDWKVLAGLDNPLARPEKGAYLSDPDLVRDPVSNEIRMYYRQTMRDVDQLFLITTRDGVQWSPPTRVLQDARNELISPAVVREDDGTWRMWTVGAGTRGCHASAARISLRERRSTNGIIWGGPTPVSLSIQGHVPWHWDVQYIRAKREYWALVAAYPDGADCTRTSVFFARSGDGTTWLTSPSPLLGRHVAAPLRDLVYRSTFRYFPKHDVVGVWFSGARLEADGYHFALAAARYPLAELLRRVEAPYSASASLRWRADDERSRMSRVAHDAFVERFP